MRLEEIETQEDFNETLEGYKMSSASIDVIDEAIKKLKATFPQFDVSDRLPTQQLLDEIRAGEADISDMGGF